jgi:hypothetical protein
MKYITQPPEPTEFKSLDIPAFMKKNGRYNAPKIPVFSLRYILSLIRWAELEYNDVVNYFVIRRDINTVKHLKSHHTIADVIATTSQFKALVENIDSETWNSYPAKLQDYLIAVKNNYDARYSQG